MALDGFTIGNAAQGGGGASPATAPAPSTSALSGFSIGKQAAAPAAASVAPTALKGVTFGPAMPKAASSAGASDSLDIQPISAPFNTSSLFSGFKDATNATTPKTLLPKSDMALPPTLDLSGFSDVPDLSNPIKVAGEGDALETIGTKIQKDSAALEAATADLKNKKDAIDLTDQKSVDAYNASVKKYQTQIDTYNKNYTEYQTRVTNYNKAVGVQNTPSVYTGKSLTGTSISRNDGSSRENSLKEYLSSNGAPDWMVNNPMTDEVGASYNTLQNSIDSFAKAGGQPVSTQAGKLITIVTNFGGMLFSPFSGALKLAESPKDPNALLRLGAIGVDKFFSMFGEALKGDVEVPLEALGVSKDLAGPVSDLVAFIGQAWVGDSIHEALPIVKDKVADIQTAFTKDVITTHFPGQRVFFDSSKVKDIWQTGKLLTDKERGDIIQTLGGDPAKIKDAIKNGVAIGIEPRTLVTLQDKPYWSKIKSVFGIGPDDGTIVSDSGGTASASVRGYIGSGEIHPILKEEVKAAVAEHGPDVTHQALQDNLGIDAGTAGRVIANATRPTTEAELAQAHQETLAKVAPEALPAVSPVSKYTPAETTQASDLKLTETVDKAVESGEAIVIDPDNIKKMAGNDYSAENARTYSHLAELQYDHALSVSKEPVVKIIAGGPGSGKSEIALPALSNGFKGVIYDAPNAVPSVVERRIAKAVAAGKQAQVYVVLADPVTAREYALIREIVTGRSGPVDYHVNTHVAIPEMAKYLHQNGVKLFIKDVRNLSLKNAKDAKWINDPKEIMDLLHAVNYDKVDLTKKISDVKLTEEQLKKAHDEKRAREQSQSERGVAERRAKEAESAKKSGVKGNDEASQADRQVKALAKDISELQGHYLDEGSETEDYSELESKVISGLKELGYTFQVSEMQNDISIGVTTNDIMEAQQKMAALVEAMHPDIKLKQNDDGTLTLYHGTTEANAASIIADQGSESLYLSSSTEKEVAGVNGASYYGKAVVEVTVDPRGLEFKATGEFWAGKSDIVNVKEYVPKDLEKESKLPTTLSQFNRLSRANQEKVFGDLPQDLQQQITGMTNEDLGKNEKPVISDILSGKIKIQIPESIKSEVMNLLGKGNYMRIFRTSGNHSSLDEIATDNGYSNDKALLEDIAQSINSRRMALQGGFANPGKIAADVVAKVKDIKDIVERQQHVDDIVGQISGSLYKEEGTNKAFKVRLTRFVEQAREGSTAAEREHVYHYMEDNQYPLTDKERTTILPIVERMDTLLEDLREQAREAGIYITGDIMGEMTPRNAMEKGGVIDRALEAYQKGKKMISNGGKLTTSVGSGSKRRVFHALTDENGKRTVVAIKDNKITSFKNKVLSDLGSTEAVVNPKFKEFYDQNVMPKLEKLAADLGITHERLTTAAKGLGGGRAGVSFGGKSLIKTRAGTPERVLIHEIGHQLDERYGMQEIFSRDDTRNYGRDTMKDELRNVADLRIEGLTIGKDVTEHYAKSYIRSGSEKIAAMFEAYLHVPDKFKDVAPNLFEKFEEFLKQHDELKPIQGIERSITLGGRKMGGELVSGRVGNTFVDKNGKAYKVGQATTLEITKHTGQQYYKDPLANYALAIERTARAVRAKNLLEKIKESPEYKDAIIKDGEGDIPANFKRTKLDQFRGYSMEPHLAEAFDDIAQRQGGGLHIPIYDEVNRLLVSAIVINPIMHFPNVAMGWGSEVAAVGAFPKLDFMETLKEVMNKSPEYLDWIEKGASLQYLRETNAEFADAMLKDFTDQMVKTPDAFDKITKVLGYANPIEWAKGLEKVSSAATWIGNDVMLYHALKEYARVNNVSKEAAIAEVSKRMADYRIPPRVLGSRALSVAMQNNGVLMFMRYHYSGVIKPWLENVYDSARPGATRAQRYAGLRTLAYFAAMYALWNYGINPAIQKATGNPAAYMSMPGAMKEVQNVQKAIQSKSPAPLITGNFSLTPGAKIVGSILSGGYDLGNFAKQIWGPGGEGTVTLLTGQVSPYKAIANAFTGQGSWTDFGLSLVGVFSSKNTTPTLVLNSMLNVEKPQIVAGMKAKIAAGDTAGATELAREFNVRLKAQIKAADISNGNSGSDARVEYFFSQAPNGLNAKGFAARIPSAQSMANYESKQGLNSGQKLLPGAANKTSKLGKPSDINNNTDPGTIKTVEHGVMIYNRMSNELAVRDQLLNQAGTTFKPNTYQLDHVIPLEGGGTNMGGNLQILTVAMDNINQPVEDFVGQEVKNGNMTAAEAREVSIRFKAGLGQPLTPELMSEFKNKYGAKPLNLMQIYEYKTTLDK